MGQPEAALKVMVIDDSKTIRRTAQMLLGEAGCTVITATDGFDALAKIVDHHPDIIFVDVLMPRLDGYQTCAVIKHNSMFKDTPVVMLSSVMGCSTRPAAGLSALISFDQAFQQGRTAGRDQGACAGFRRRSTTRTLMLRTWRGILSFDGE